MIDTVKIKLVGGSGGNGCVSFRRERSIPKGGPDGGDGGRGGNIYLCGRDSLNSLLHLSFNSIFRAERGGHGGGKNRHGRNGEHRVINVPMGTIVWEMGSGIKSTFVCEILDDEPVLVCEGGRGGKGNDRFTTSVNQVPLLAEGGEPGASLEVFLELKLLADVGIIGMPNAGKSTLLSACSRAKPKVADYQFTTIEPVLGMVDQGESNFLLVEIPGLLEGAHLGKGLGHEFLRHAERTRLFWHVVDGMCTDMVDRVRKIRDELRLFSTILAEKPQVILINKIDVTEARDIAEAREKELDAMECRVFYLSAVTGEGIDHLIKTTIEVLKDIPKHREDAQDNAIDRQMGRRMLDKPEVWKEGVKHVVSSPRVARLMALVNLSDRRVRIQFWRELKRMGIIKALEGQGVEVGDTVVFDGAEMRWE